MKWHLFISLLSGPFVCAQHNVGIRYRVPGCCVLFVCYTYLPAAGREWWTCGPLSITWGLAGWRCFSCLGWSGLVLAACMLDSGWDGMVGAGLAPDGWMDEWMDDGSFFVSTCSVLGRDSGGWIRALVGCMGFDRLWALHSTHTHSHTHTTPTTLWRFFGIFWRWTHST